MKTIPTRLMATCMRCPRRATCRLWRDPGDQWCEHWPVDTLPSLPTLARRLVAATARHVLSGARKVNPEQLAVRRAFCTACVHWNAKAFAGLGRCRHTACGCSGVKLEWATSECPMQKWGAIPPEAL